MNGVHLPKIFNIRTLLFKFMSCVFAVSSGLPVGPEGPMIHLGALVGAGVSQGSSKSFGTDIKFLRRFRNPTDRRDFINSGAGNGMAAAFGAPIGGVLFAMEEVASKADTGLNSQILLACVGAAFVSDFFHGAIQGFRIIAVERESEDGFLSQVFHRSTTARYAVGGDVNFHLGSVLVSFLLACIGGLLGAGFTWFNLQVVKARKRFIKPYRIRSLFEPVLYMVIVSSIVIGLASTFPCREVHIAAEGKCIIPSVQP